MKYFCLVVLFLSSISSFAQNSNISNSTDKCLKSEDPEVQKYLDEEIDFRPVEHKKRWDYGHAFLPQDPKAYEEYLKGSLNKTGEYHVYDFVRAMELAMYYLGFDKNVFYAIGWNVSSNTFDLNEPPYGYIYDVPDYFLVHPRKEIRDKEKLLYWLEKADVLADEFYKDVEWPCDVICFYLILSCQIEGLIEFEKAEYLKSIIVLQNSLQKNRREYYMKINDRRKNCKKDLKKMDSFLKNEKRKLIPENVNQKYIENDLSFSLTPFIAYAYYKGICVEKNSDKAKGFLHLLPPYVWRIFWAGWIVPKDQEFAKFILKFHNTPYSRAQLKRIESGYYDARD